MKYIKKFENIENTTPEVGDCVLINIDTIIIKGKIRDFVNNTIGEIIDIRLKIEDEFDNESLGDLRVKYSNVPKDIQSWFFNGNIRTFNINQMIEFGKTKEELELKIMSKKYNL